MAIQIPVNYTDKNGSFTTLAVADMTGDGTDTIRQFTNDGRTLLFINNGTGSSATVTLKAAVAPNSKRAVDVVYTIADGETFCVGKIIPDNFNESNKVTLELGSADAALLMYAVSAEAA